MWVIPCKCYVDIKKKIYSKYIYGTQAIAPTNSTQSNKTITTSQQITKQTQTIQTPNQKKKKKKQNFIIKN